MNANNSITGNIGEWSEVYVLLKLLGEGRLYAADADLRPNPDLFFPLIKVTRREASGKNLEFHLHTQDDTVRTFANGELSAELPASSFLEEAVALYEEMSSPHERPSFSVPRTEYFITELGCEAIKAKSCDKTDIAVQIHDPQTGYEPISGFSIKSQVGHPSSLLNATRATNFTFKVNGLSDGDIVQINSIDGPRKIIDRMNAVFSRSRSVSFSEVDNNVFSTNMMLVDSRMAEIIAEALLIHYRDNVKSVREVVDILEEDNPLGFPAPGFYRHKVKKFLCAIALGMQPASPWDGNDEANGGYVIVTSAGDVVAYHIYNRDHFEEYLFETTNFERGSTSRHGFADLYKDGRSTFMKLNLQIRF